MQVQMKGKYIDFAAMATVLLAIVLVITGDITWWVGFLFCLSKCEFKISWS